MNLQTYFAFQIITELVMLVLPILLSYWEINKACRGMEAFLPATDVFWPEASDRSRVMITGMLEEIPY